MTIAQTIDTIDEAFLQSLIRDQVAESDTLDYKRDMYGTSDGDTKELLRDISAMANNLGGYLLIGIEEANEVPVQILGIEQGDIAVERILSSSLAGITERVYGLDSRSIPLANGRAVVAVFVPPSSRAPHMVIARDEDRFWIRHGRQKMRMSIDEIRQACFRVQNLVERLENFVERERRQASGTAPLANYCLLRVALTPFSLAEDRFDVGRQDIRELIRQPPGMRRNGFVISFPSCPAKPTLYGLKAEVEKHSSMQVYRNGHVEFRAWIENFPVREVPCFHPLQVVEYTVNTVRFYATLARILGILDSAISSIDLFFLRGWSPGRHFEYDRSWEARPWSEDHLTLPAQQFTNLMSDPDRVAKLVLDRLWQAFGYEHAPFFENGAFTAPR